MSEKIINPCSTLHLITLIFYETLIYHLRIFNREKCFFLLSGHYLQKMF